MRTVTILALAVAMAATLSACGRKGRPIPPEGAYTRQYPDIQFPEQQRRQEEPDQQQPEAESTPR